MSAACSRGFFIQRHSGPSATGKRAPARILPEGVEDRGEPRLRAVATEMVGEAGRAVREADGGPERVEHPGGIIV